LPILSKYRRFADADALNCCCITYTSTVSMHPKDFDVALNFAAKPDGRRYRIIIADITTVF
jgi:hypothetical protein